jgi:hypothetical protein
METTVEIAGSTPARKKPEENFFLTSRQLARRWGLCRQTILKVSRECQLPSVTFGGQTVRYPLEQIREIERKIIGSKFPIMRAIREACGRGPVRKIRGRGKISVDRVAARNPVPQTPSAESEGNL